MGEQAERVEPCHGCGYTHGSVGVGIRCLQDIVRASRVTGEGHGLAAYEAFRRQTDPTGTLDWRDLRPGVRQQWIEIARAARGA